MWANQEQTGISSQEGDKFMIRNNYNTQKHKNHDIRRWFNKYDEMIKFCVDCMTVIALVTLDKNEVPK